MIIGTETADELRVAIAFGHTRTIMHQSARRTYGFRVTVYVCWIVFGIAILGSRYDMRIAGPYCDTSTHRCIVMILTESSMVLSHRLPSSSIFLPSPTISSLCPLHPSILSSFGLPFFLFSFPCHVDILVSFTSNIFSSFLVSRVLAP